MRQPPPEHVSEIEQELHRVHAALVQLKERTRDIFVLIRLEKMKQSTVADMLVKAPPSTTRS